jgi:hypothetical protein
VHPRTPIGLDPDHHLYRAGILVDVFADHRVQPGYPGDPVGQLRLAESPARIVLQLDIMKLLGPIIADEHRSPHRLPSTVDHLAGNRRETTAP